MANTTSCPDHRYWNVPWWRFKTTFLCPLKFTNNFGIFELNKWSLFVLHCTYAMLERGETAVFAGEADFNFNIRNKEPWKFAPRTEVCRFYNLPIFEILVHSKGSSKEGIFTACCDININMVIKICGRMDACQTCSAVIGGHQFHEEEWNDLWLKSLTHNGKSKHKKMTAEMRKIEFAQKCWAFEIMSILFSRRETIHYRVSLSVSHKRNNTLFLYW